MTLQQRIDLVVRLGKYIRENDLEWKNAKERAFRSNPWFVPEFIENSSKAIVENLLQQDALKQWAHHYNVPEKLGHPKLVGIVMAGNLPLVGFHDFLCTFIAGHRQLVKLSSKDEVLLKHLIGKLYEWNKEVNDWVTFAEKLNGCEVYIATGSNNSGRYFDYYFGKYPNIIRRNRTSVALLEGNETPEELDGLADDMQMYFGLGCRNVTKLFVPEGYDFIPLLKALEKYNYFLDYHKYRHNYDYQLALLMMGSKLYMTNGSILISKNESFFTAISQVNYEFYFDKESLINLLRNNPDVQCIVHRDGVPFGEAQSPTLTDYADGVDTMKFLGSLL